jgi:Methylamine utilisation protein MauE
VTPDALAPPLFVAAGLLVLAGAIKLVAPEATAQALLDAGLPGSRGVARGVGVAEIAAGLWACVAPATGGAIACGALYLAFAVFLSYVLLAHPDAGSCGCAGPTPVPPSRLHLGLDLLAVAVALAYPFTTAPSLPAWIGSLGWAAVPVVGGMALAGWLAVVSVTLAPQAFRAWEPPAPDHEHDGHGHDHRITDVELQEAGVMAGHASLWPGTKSE